ncbi:MAG: hypothetical protein CXR30_18930 [Geobacter sp.]|nr:MAG: hypothetical protein CXR30_18930 [Geobacter sp.]
MRGNSYPANSTIRQEISRIGLSAFVFCGGIETAIRENWERVCEEAELSPVDKNYLWGRQFLNPFSIER